MSESVKTRRSSLGRKTGSGYGKSFAKKRSESTATAKKSPVVLGPSKTDFNGLNPFSLDERPNRILTESQMDSLSLYYQTVTTNPDRKELASLLETIGPQGINGVSVTERIIATYFKQLRDEEHRVYSQPITIQEEKKLVVVKVVQGNTYDKRFTEEQIAYLTTYFQTISMSPESEEFEKILNEIGREGEGGANISRNMVALWFKKARDQPALVMDSPDSSPSKKGGGGKSDKDKVHWFRIKSKLRRRGSGNQRTPPIEPALCAPSRSNESMILLGGSLEECPQVSPIMGLEAALKESASSDSQLTSLYRTNSTSGRYTPSSPRNFSATPTSPLTLSGIQTQSPRTPSTPSSPQTFFSSPGLEQPVGSPLSESDSLPLSPLSRKLQKKSGLFDKKSGVSQSPLSDEVLKIPLDVPVRLKAHNHHLTRFLLHKIKNAESEEQKTDVLLKLDGSPEDLFLTCLKEEVQVKPLPSVMRERTEAVRILQRMFLQSSADVDLSQTISPLLKLAPTLGGENSKALLSSRSEKLTLKLKKSLKNEFISILDASLVPAWICRLCFLCAELVEQLDEEGSSWRDGGSSVSCKSHDGSQEEISDDGVEIDDGEKEMSTKQIKIKEEEGEDQLEEPPKRAIPVSHWAVGALYLLRFMIPKLIGKGPGGVFLGKVIMRLCSKSFFPGSCHMNEVMTDTSTYFDQFCADIQKRGRSEMMVPSQFSCPVNIYVSEHGLKDFVQFLWEEKVSMEEEEEGFNE
eukprot:CAMPEP_0201503494 /NCGR_PEP_ID=MMETSP0151_2-20130828/84695_1 /ASSEMBLY_ACC=CAM_ASM_000257 /TAXON_ID=200890 /ORGANISM="Paramoeba atlantica, Strain 621/1 / CCAP 1560/9" /LENGTH=746 /DNA_ID=CAMNT_0047897157 /DNA_START=150 /DNA_END=2387 /DNA_ORIENTATION=-